MTITSADLKFLAAESSSDLATGGGRRTATALQDGIENNLFPDIPTAYRASGGVQMRKLYPSVLSANADVLSAAQVALTGQPTDSALDVVVFAFGDQATTRAAAAAELARRPLDVSVRHQWVDAGTTSTTQFPSVASIAPGTPVGHLFDTGIAGYPRVPPKQSHVVTSVSAGSYHQITLADPIVTAGAGSALWELTAAANAPKCYGAATLTGGVSAGATSLPVSRVRARVVPNINPYPMAVTGIEPRQEETASYPGGTGASGSYGPGSVTFNVGLSQAGGHVPIFRVGDSVLISGGGNSEAALVTFVDYRGALTLAAGLTYAYPSGAVVSSLLNLGDLNASIGPSFSQQTWTRQWSDALIGSAIGATYDRSAGAITTTNLGAITERWAFVFTSPTAFKLIGEKVGQVASGTTAATFAPLNPLTNTPYFSIPAAGWGSGWATGNVWRVPTVGAYSALWAVRCVSPSVAGGTDGSKIRLLGSVDA